MTPVLVAVVQVQAGAFPLNSLICQYHNFITSQGEHDMPIEISMGDVVMCG